MNLLKQIGQTFSLTKQLGKKNWQRFLLSLLFLLAITIIVVFVMIFIYSLFYGNSDPKIPVFDIIWWCISTIIFLFLVSLVQIVLINSLISAENKFSQTIKKVKDYFWKIFGLTIIINLLFILFSVPIYAALVLFIFKLTALGLVTLLFGYIIFVLLTCFIIFSPFILIIENTGIIESIKRSFHLVKDKLIVIFVQIIILSIIFFLLNWFSSISMEINFILGLIINLIILILLSFLLTAYPIAMYQQYKK